MQTKIVVPLDGSPLSEAVLPQAKLLARATGSTLILLRVAAPPLLTEPLVSSLPAPVITLPTQQQDAEIAQPYLEETARQLDAEGFAVRTVLLEGDPAAAIVLFAGREPNVLLIAMATHGRSGLGRWLFGSIAEKVLQAAPVPLLLVRPCPEAPITPRPHSYKTILVPVDGSVFAEQALDQACALASTTGASLLLVSAVPALEDAAAEATGAIPVWELEHHEAQV